MPINPDSPFALLPEVRRADDIATLSRNLRSLQIPIPGGSACNVVIPENQISAKGSGTISFVAADTNRRQYLPTMNVEWDTGILFGQYLLRTGGGFIQISQADFYLILIQLDSFSNAGDCNVSFFRSSDSAVLHERTTTITLGSDTDHKAGTMTMGVFNAAAGENYSIVAWHTGGGSCVANVTVLQLF